MKSRRKSPKTDQEGQKAPNLATDFASNWGEVLKKHISGAHEEEALEGTWSITWNAFFIRTKVTLERKLKVEPGLLERLLAEKTCKMNCDFEVKSGRFLSVYKAKLLKHYSTEHFGAELLQKESQFFRGKRFPQCVICGFEIKQSSNLNTKAAHIGVTHNEIVPILKRHFDQIPRTKSEQ